MTVDISPDECDRFSILVSSIWVPISKYNCSWTNRIISLEVKTNSSLWLFQIFSCPACASFELFSGKMGCWSLTELKGWKSSSLPFIYSLYTVNFTQLNLPESQLPHLHANLRILPKGKIHLSANHE